MKSIVLLLLALLIMNSATGQTWLWQQRFDTNSDADNFNALAVDDFGNVYTAVQFEGLLSIGSYSFQSNSIEDVCLTKMDSSGNVLWALAFGGLYWDQVNGMDCDTEGNVYLAGHFMTSMQIADQTIVGSTGRDIFVMRINADGTLGWVQQGSNVWDEEASDLKVDGNGDVIISGAANNTAVIGGMQLFSADPSIFFQGFVAKFSAQGDPIWLQSAGAIEYSSSSYTQSALAIGPDNSIHYTDMRLGGIDFAGIVDPGPDDINVILLKWSSEGMPLMGWVGLSDFNDFMHDVAVDQQGRIYLAVTALTSFEFAGQSVQFPAGEYGMCLLRLLPDGTEDSLWLMNGTSDSRIYSIASSPQNEIWFGGFERDIIHTPFGDVNAYGDQNDRDGFLVKLDANTDAFTAYTRIAGSGWQFIRDVDISSSGYVYTGADVTGSVDTPVYYGMENQLTDAMEINAQSQPAVCRLENLLCSSEQLFPYDVVTLCPNASIALQVDIPIFTLLWTDGSASGEYSVTEPGTVDVTVVTLPGCIVHDSVMVIAEIPPQLNWVLQPVSCAGAFDGSIAIEVVGSNPPYSITWNGASVANQFGGIGAGTYFLETSNSDGCFTSATIEMTEPAPIEIEYSAIFDDASGLGSIVVNQITGGTPPYIFFWPAHPQADDSLIAVEAGSYIFQVTDASGCFQEFNVLLSTGVEELMLPSLRCYPQPTADVLIAEAVESFEWELRDATGRMLQQSSVFNIRHRIDLSRYAAGSYVLIATTQREGTRSFMLVKQ
jgi:hypothetical protein